MKTLAPDYRLKFNAKTVLETVLKPRAIPFISVSLIIGTASPENPHQEDTSNGN